eukprot:4808667-Lingulodinium_polyedra.AAC.1
MACAHQHVAHVARPSCVGLSPLSSSVFVPRCTYRTAAPEFPTSLASNGAQPFARLALFRS